MQKVIEYYKQQFGNDYSIIKSPLRICPLGAHIDHQHGFVTGMALDSSIYMAYGKTESGDCGTRYIFHKSPHFLGECGGKLFEGKGIKRVGLGFDNLMYLVPIPQKNTFSMEV